MNILVPIDFSPASLKALNYAYEIADALSAKVYLLHIISKRKKHETEKGKLEEIQEIEKKMTRLSRIYPNQSTNSQCDGISIFNLVRTGKIEEVIPSICKTNQIDLMVLGVRQKHSLLDFLLGSMSTILIKLSPCPLIIVPEKTRINTISHIAIASDEDKISKPLLAFIDNLSNKLKAKVERVYVYPLPKDFSDKKEEVYNPTLLEDQIDPEAEMIVVRDPFVVRGLDYFIEKHQIDLLALYVPERKSFQKIFHRSLSKRMAYHSLTPLLIWNEKTNNKYEVLD